MQKFPSTEAKDKWGVIIDTALQEPVTITKHGRPSLVVTSIRDYEELQRIKYERLKADVRAGFEELNSGNHTKLGNEKELHAFMEGIKESGRKRLDE